MEDRGVKNDEEYYRAIYDIISIKLDVLIQYFNNDLSREDKDKLLCAII